MKEQPDPPLEDYLRRDQELFNELSQQPLITILGIVHALGAGGGQVRGQQHWALRFKLDAWRIEGQSVQTDPLTVLQRVTHEELQQLMRNIAPNVVLRIQARILKDSRFGGPQALLELIISPDASDAELNALAAELRKPVIREDPLFGTLTLDRRFNIYTAETT